MQDGPVWSGVFVDKNAPANFHDNAGLLNAMDRAEKRKDAQTGLNFIAALPHQLSDEERAHMVRDFIREQFFRKHLAAVAHIHRPSGKGDDRNDHVHILASTRTVSADGFSEKKAILWKDREQHLETWREKWAQLGERYLKEAGHHIEAERWRYGHLTNEQQHEKAIERGDT